MKAIHPRVRAERLDARMSPAGDVVIVNRGWSPSGRNPWQGAMKNRVPIGTSCGARRQDNASPLLYYKIISPGFCGGVNHKIAPPELK